MPAGASPEQADWQSQLISDRLQALNDRVTNQHKAERQLLRQVVKRKQKLEQGLARVLPPGLAARIKRIQLVLDIIKGVSIVTSLFTAGLDGISLLTFFLTANGELLASIFIPYWQQSTWRKVAVLVMDVMVLLVVGTLVGLFLYIKYDPAGACSLMFGGAWLPNTSCSVMGPVFEAVL